METQETIYQWARETFGEPRSNRQIYERARDEFEELGWALAHDDHDPKAVEEIADVFIVLCQIAERMGYSLQAAIDGKMQVNRARKWKTDGNGVGQHIDCSDCGTKDLPVKTYPLSAILDEGSEA